MSRKRNKKHSFQGKKAAENPMELQQTGKTKRLDPAARNLLYMDLVFLAASQIMSGTGHLNETAVMAVTIVGVVILAAALYLQFKPKDPMPKGPKL